MRGGAEGSYAPRRGPVATPPYGPLRWLEEPHFLGCTEKNLQNVTRLYIKIEEKV
jgi:hypothetical protein